MPGETDLNCFLCGMLAHRHHSENDNHDMDCSRCGWYRITGSAASQRINEDLKPLLSAWVREQYDRNSENPPELDSNKLVELSKTLPRLSVIEKQLVLLRAIASSVEFPGQPSSLKDPKFHASSWSRNKQEFEYHVFELTERKLLTYVPKGGGLVYFITTAGYEYLEAQGKPNKSNQAFVAMAFADEMKSFWTDALNPAIRAAGYRPFRVDQEPNLEQKIDARIIANIRESRFLVADVSLHRQGVYYEAGYAQGLGLPVIWMVRENDKDHMHFDTRQFPHIIWPDFEYASSQLTALILATIGRGPV